MTIEVQMPRRSANIIARNEFAADLLSVIVGTVVPCHVLGIFPDNDGGAFCLCELISGRMVELDPSYVQFTDIDERGNII